MFETTRTDIIRKGSADEFVAKRNRALELYQRGLEMLGEAVKVHKDVGNNTYAGYEINRLPGLEFFRKKLDADVWLYMVDALGLRNFMDAQAFKKFCEETTMENELVEKMVKIGYCVSPNNTNNIPGVIMYPRGPGILEPKEWSHEVLVTHDRIRIFKTQFFGKPYTRESWTDTVTVAVFDTVEKFLEWTKINGKRSEPGIPAYSQGNWD